ncbi:MAG: peptidylprolyl isomerase [Rhodanobacteraceae bacterium]
MFACVRGFSAALLAWVVFLAPLSAAAAPADIDAVVVSQDGVSVTLGDVDAFAAHIPEKDRAGFFDSPVRIQNMLTGLLVQKQLAVEARTLGLDKNPEVALQIRQATNEVLARARMKRFRDDIKLPDFAELAREEYLGHKDKYVVQGRTDVKHILVSTKARNEEEAKTLAQTIEGKARTHPDQFGDLVEKYSDDPSKSDNHGLMTDVGSGRYDPAFAAAAAALKTPGDISPIVKTRYGFHVLKLIARVPDRQQAFAEVKDKIIKKLRSDYIDKAVANHTDKLRNQKLDANPDLVASLRTRYESKPETPAAIEPSSSGN